jgi:hypothetical protein
MYVGHLGWVNSATGGSVKVVAVVGVVGLLGGRRGSKHSVVSVALRS